MVWAVSLSTEELIPQGLTPDLGNAVFGVWLKAVGWWPPTLIQYLYPREPSVEASPKAISGRTR